MCAPVIERVEMSIHIRYVYRCSRNVEEPYVTRCDVVRATDSCEHAIYLEDDRQQRDEFVRLLHHLHVMARVL